MIHFIITVRGVSICHNSFRSWESAKLAAEKHFKLGKYEIVELYPVDMDCVKDWIANPPYTAEMDMHD